MMHNTALKWKFSYHRGPVGEEGVLLSMGCSDVGLENIASKAASEYCLRRNTTALEFFFPPTATNLDPLAAMSGRSSTRLQLQLLPSWPPWFWSNSYKSSCGYHLIHLLQVSWEVRIFVWCGMWPVVHDLSTFFKKSHVYPLSAATMQGEHFRAEALTSPILFRLASTLIRDMHRSTLN